MQVHILNEASKVRTNPVKKSTAKVINLNASTYSNVFGVLALTDKKLKTTQIRKSRSAH